MSERKKSAEPAQGKRLQDPGVEAARDFEGKTCFVITPIGGDGTATRRATDGLLDAVIEPVLVEMGFVLNVAHRMSGPGDINVQIVKEILDADLAIVNLTGCNPNVMYELAVRHCAVKPVVSIAVEGTDLPFDVKQFRTIQYDDDMAGVIDLRKRLTSSIIDAMNQIPPFSPMARFAADLSFQNSLPKGSRDEVLLKKMDQMQSEIADIRRGIDSTTPIDVRLPRSRSKVSVIVTADGDRRPVESFLERVRGEFDCTSMSEGVADGSEVIRVFHNVRNLPNWRIHAMLERCADGLTLKSFSFEKQISR